MQYYRAVYIVHAVAGRDTANSITPFHYKQFTTLYELMKFPVSSAKQTTGLFNFVEIQIFN